MPNPIIERAARAIIQQLGVDGLIHEAGGKLSVDGVVPEHLARAVIRAIREPSEGMIEAGGNVQWWESIGDDGETIETRLYPDDVPRVWQAMIDAALGEE